MNQIPKLSKADVKLAEKHNYLVYFLLPIGGLSISIFHQNFTSQKYQFFILGIMFGSYKLSSFFSKRLSLEENKFLIDNEFAKFESLKSSFKN